MSQLVNDKGNSLSSPCRTSIWGRMCTESDYKSWRKIAVALRWTLMNAEWAEASGALYEESIGWLKEWVDLSEAGGVKEMVVALAAVLRDADPVLPGGDLFPADLSWWQGTIGVGTEGVIYTQQTDALLNYIRKGNAIYDDALSKKIIKVKKAELERAEERPAPTADWIKWGIGGAAILSVLGFGVWAYAEIVRARHSRETGIS